MLRVLSREQLWNEEVPRFNAAPPRERIERVAVIRAVGVVFAAGGSAAQKEDVRAWLRGLLQDPAEKIRRYATAALPKIGAGAKEEKVLLTLLESPSGEREKKSVGRALDKIGGETTLEVVTQTPGLLPQTEQKVKAAIARKEEPSTIRMDALVPELEGLRIHLRCRKGLETIVRDEVKEFIEKNGKFRIAGMRDRVVALEPAAPFSLSEIYRMRCFATAGFVLGTVREADVAALQEALAGVIASPLSQKLFSTLTEGSLRYRMDFVGKGHQRGTVREIANRAFALCPEILNDPREAPWAIDVHQYARCDIVELRPKFAPDPRLWFRTDDVDAASHPPLAACMARVAGRFGDEIVWDPFCGSGLELIESSLLGGVRKIIGTDTSAEAVAIAKANVAAAKLEGVESEIICRDFRDYAKIDSLGHESVSLVITNPPMGRRVRVPNLRGMVTDLFAAATYVLKPGGRLVFANPLRSEPRGRKLQLQFRQLIDMGGFDCRLEVYEKPAS